MARGPTGFFGAGLVLTGSASGQHKQVRTQILERHSISLRGECFRVLDYNLAITGSFQPKQLTEIVHSQNRIGKRSGTRLSKNSVNWTRDCGDVSEMGWVFLGVAIEFRILGGGIGLRMDHSWYRCLASWVHS
jgi:hypothetical protein